MSNIYKYQTNVYGVCEEEMSYRETKCACFWDYLVPFIRFWGLLTSVVLCGVGVDVAAHQHTIGIYFIIGAAIVFFLEITWAITLFLHVCNRNEYNPVFKCWDVVLWFNLWKRSILYTGLAFLLFLRPHRLWLSIVAGMQLVILALSYLALTVRTHMQPKHAPTLLHSQSPSQEDIDRYDDITGVLDDSLPGPLNTDNLSELDQDTVLEI
ncbi:uncharacterized protein LOC142322469 isoform X1 [Lycorma delicatula]|uniref:uncharacterized protein LOC142322469 isoform X1 n=1 Tax=Lycorma delicatula TaxID=130591 RepID=UPI003F510625